MLTRVLSLCLILSLSYAHADSIGESRIVDGNLIHPALSKPIPIKDIQKVEFFREYYDPSLATSPDDKAYIQALNEEAVWITGRRFAVVQGKLIPITLSQEFQIMTARSRFEMPPPDVSTKDKKETLEAIRSLQLESLEAAIKERQELVKKQLEATRQAKEYSSRPKKVTISQETVPKVLSPARLVIDNQNIYIASDSLINFNPGTSDMNITARDNLTCNLSTTPPPTTANRIRLILKGAVSTDPTYYALTSTANFDLATNTMVMGTQETTAYCYSDTIFRDHFEGGSAPAGTQ